MSVYRPKKSRFYQYDFVIQRRRFHGSTGQTRLKAAREVEADKRRRAALGTLGEEPMTFDQAAGRWWEEKGKHKDSAADIERRVGVVVKLIGKNTLLEEIDSDLISKAIQRRRGMTFGKKAKKVPSNATVNRDMIDTTLRPILRRARRVWQVKGLPEIDWGDLREAEPKSKPHDYSAAEIGAVYGALPTWWHDFAAFEARYGCRLSEMFFPPSAVDVEGQRVLLRDRKGDDDHSIPVLAEDAAMLAARVGRAQAAGLATVWFRELKSGKLKPLTYWGAQKALGRAVRASGLHAAKGAKGSHDLRHHAAMRFLAASGDLRATQGLLGHASMQSTLVYAHARDEAIRSGLDALSRNSPEPAEVTDEKAEGKQRLAK